MLAYREPCHIKITCKARVGHVKSSTDICPCKGDIGAFDHVLHVNRTFDAEVVHIQFAEKPGVTDGQLTSDYSTSKDHLGKGIYLTHEKMVGYINSIHI